MSLNKFTFTIERLDRLKLEDGKAVKRVYDTHKHSGGLMLSVRESGRKSFLVRYKLNGKDVSVTLGKHPAMKIEQARKKAQSVTSQFVDGINPHRQQEANRAREITLADALDEYLASRQGGKKSLRQNTIDCYRRAINIHLKAWKTHTVSSITRDDVERKHRALTKHSISAADYAMRVLRAVHNYVSEKYRDEDGRPILFDNPVSQINQNKAWGELKTRSNIIDDQQMPIWFEAVESLPDWLPHSSIRPEITRDYFLFVLFTGLRRREASSIEHSWIDVDAKTLTIPSNTTKNHQAHELPLTPFLMEITKRRMLDSEQYLFENQSTGKAITEPKRAVSQIREQCGVYFTIHDLRRTFATIASRIIARDYVIKRVLNHKPLKNDVTAQSYVNLAVEDLREPMNAISEHILTLAKAKESNVIPLAVGSTK